MRLSKFLTAIYLTLDYYIDFNLCLKQNKNMYYFIYRENLLNYKQILSPMMMFLRHQRTVQSGEFKIVNAPIEPVTQTVNDSFVDSKIEPLSLDKVMVNTPKIVRNRNRFYNLVYYKKNNCVHADFCEHDTQKRVLNYNKNLKFKKDLTRYGIEPNPGPSLPRIGEYEIFVENTGTYQYCFNCDSMCQLLATDTQYIFYTNNCKMCLFVMQNQILSDEAMLDLQARFACVRNWLMDGSKHGKSFLSHYTAIPVGVDKYIDLLEDVCILAHDFIYSTCLANRYVAIVSFCKRRGSRIGFTSTLMYVAADLFGSDQINSGVDPLQSEIEQRLAYSPQADDAEDNIFAEARKYVNCYEKLKDTTIYKKLYKFSLYVLTLGLLDGIKIDFNSMNFSKFESKCIKETHKPGLDMIHCFLDTILFVCDKGMQYFKCGDVDVIFHSGSSYEKWVGKANKLLCDSKFLNNPEPLGIDKFSFLSELKEAIEKGSAIVKFANGMDKHEKLYVNRILNDLRMLEAEQLTRKAAQMPRKDPFAVLIHGSSSICKSQLKQILFYHYGKVFDLPTTADYMYTRCPTDEYWSGFNSTQWCIVMDDIAFLKPNGEVDPTLKEMLQVKNSVPYTPPQASLEDKGRTPVRAELLIGTTNTKHLNLYAYFACPFAIARRMSYVITAKVKPQYSKHNFMADSNKIPSTQDGEYMNIWDFEIAIPVPQLDIEVDNQQSKYVVIHRFTDINDLLVWYIKAAKEHESAQTKALNADKVMLNVTVCKTCYKAESKCSCFQPQSALEILETHSKFFQFQMWLYKQIILGCVNPDIELLLYLYSYIQYNLFPVYILFFMWFFMQPLLCFKVCAGPVIMYLLYKYIWVLLHTFCAYTGGIAWKYRLMFRLTNNCEETYRFLIALAGDRIKRMHFTNTDLTKLAAFLSLPMVILAVKKAYNSAYPKQKPYDEQGNVGVSPVPIHDEKPTFYYHNPYVNTDIEISGASKCSQGDIISNYVERATAKFRFKFTELPGKFSASIGININGNIWLLNNHAIKYDSGVFDVIIDSEEQNISRNIKAITFCAKDVVRIPNTDLALLQVRALPPGKNIFKYFPLDKMIKGRYSGFYHLISKQGDRSRVDISNIQGNAKCPVFGVAGYFARVHVPTQVGDCGAMCIANIGDSQVLLGTHTAGNPDGGIFLQHISQAMLAPYMSNFNPQIECGTIPISAPGYERSLGPVHHKSTLRFIEKGTAHVMGSFMGYRPKHKSRVKDTFIKDYVVQSGYKANCGAPDMSWKPWHLALTDMVAPQYTFNNEVLDICENAFFNDILDVIGDKVLDLQVYTQDVALNGVDGVTFVDMLNTSTSAGNPFKKSKKHFITLSDSGKIAEIDSVIQQRVDDICACYDEGRRFHPQFCGHLKDEPTPFKKILAGKTRVFTGGEFAWSIVVRRYLLSHIRLIQNNPYAFEAMPGIVAQSKEWNTLYNYLTKFGKNKIIAGDYGKFDKKMAAAFILSAFRILERLAKQAGWPEEDLVYIRCIANDTAFPTIDFNGELIEIQGNPSGHPLTVIINCLVNSLYMRYAYYYVSKKPINTFRKYVNLATYGDDNIMGVSDECPDFNHTRIAIIMKMIGVEYTMAEKEAVSIPYIHIDDSSFLKRKFVFDSDIGKVICPLDHSSIDKMLTSRLDEGTLDIKAHSICVIETALREYFFYGKQKFEDRRLFFLQLVKDCGLEDWVEKSTFPDYDQLLSDFHLRLKDYPDHDVDIQRKLWE